MDNYIPGQVTDTHIAIQTLNTIVNELKALDPPKAKAYSSALSAISQVARRVVFKRCYSTEATADETDEFIITTLGSDYELLEIITMSFYARTGYIHNANFYRELAETMLTTAQANEPLPGTTTLMEVLRTRKIACVLYLILISFTW